MGLQVVFVRGTCEGMSRCRGVEQGLFGGATTVDRSSSLDRSGTSIETGRTSHKRPGGLLLFQGPIRPFF